LAPLAAACGVVVPKMSGRGLGHTGGTLDKLEAIPGFRVALSLDEFLAALQDVGCCLISQTRDIAPADKKLYGLRDVTATIESIPLISASVMSKKLAEGSNALVLDVKCGSGAFMKTPPEASALARSLVANGTANGVRTEAFITAMDAPLGNAVGNALEIAECVDTLHGRGPSDLETLIVRLATRMVQLAEDDISDGVASARVSDALRSGAALAKFEAMVARQGGDREIVRDPLRLPQATHRHVVPAVTGGYLHRLDAELVGRASMLLGAGRAKVSDTIDPAAGVMIHRKPGDSVAAGDPLLELHYNDGRSLDAAVQLAARAIEIADRPPPESALVLDHVK
ncbi:MAG: thymidine phosphorylase, partial [Vicinamibacterales bacterium]